MNKMSAPIEENLGTSFTVRLKLKNEIGALANVTRAIADAGGDIGAIDLVRSSKEENVRDFSVTTADVETSIDRKSVV